MKKLFHRRQIFGIQGLIKSLKKELHELVLGLRHVGFPQLLRWCGQEPDESVFVSSLGFLTQNLKKPSLTDVVQCILAKGPPKDFSSHCAASCWARCA